MSDPFLIAHLIGPLHADIGFPISPVSMRDQMVRARMLIQRAATVGLIDASRPLLVVGAGVAGVTAAVEAARLGVTVELVERSYPFSRQLASTTRWIEPTLYDWPVDHWDQGSYPWIHRVFAPLPWRGGFARTVATGWLSRFALMLRAFRPHLTLIRGIVAPPPYAISAPIFGAPLIEVSVRGVAKDYGLLLTCGGVGTEQTSTPGFQGTRFWDNDTLVQPNAGTSPTGARPRVLISGGGDGALQDFLRAATGKDSARFLLDDLRSVAAVAHAIEGIEKRIYSAEDQAARSAVWSGSALGRRAHTDDHLVQSELQEAHLDAVNQVWSTAGGAITSILAPLIKSRGIDVTLTHPCGHFSACYALNRFLVLLLERFSREATAAPALQVHAFTKLDDVKVASPLHVAQFRAGACGGMAVPNSYSPPSTDYELVVIRHGIAGGTASRINDRQLLPYRPPS